MVISACVVVCSCLPRRHDKAFRYGQLTLLGWVRKGLASRRSGPEFFLNKTVQDGAFLSAFGDDSNNRFQHWMTTKS